MKRHLHNLFIPHHGNNHKPRLLHHLSLTKLVLLVLFVQLVLTGISQVKPGVLGYASNISVQDIVTLTNQQRSNQGLAPLSTNPVLTESARAKGIHMFSNNYWAHNAPDGTTPWNFIKNAGYTYLYAGENLARDFGDSSSVVDAWMASPTHRDNLLSGRYDEIGVAVINGLLDGQETTLVVQHFGKAAAAVPSVSTVPAAQVVQGVANEPEPIPDPQPEVAVQEPQAAPIPIQEALPPTSLTQADTSITDTPPTAWLSSFDVTKSVNLALALILVIVLALDAFLIWHRGTTRRSGKSFVHLSLFVLVVLIILLTGSGNII